MNPGVRTHPHGLGPAIPSEFTGHRSDIHLLKSRYFANCSVRRVAFCKNGDDGGRKPRAIFLNATKAIFREPCLPITHQPWADVAELRCDAVRIVLRFFDAAACLLYNAESLAAVAYGDLLKQIAVGQIKFDVAPVPLADVEKTWPTKGTHKCIV